MSKRRHKQRMFTRKERQIEREAVMERARLITQADVDRARIEMLFGAPATSALQVGEAWLDLFGESHRDAYENELLWSLAREFERLHGTLPTRDIVSDLADADADCRDAEAAAFLDAHPEIEESFGTTDAGFEERILDAEIAAAEGRPDREE